MRVGGDLALQNAGAVNIQAVGGDCKVVAVTGPLVIQRVGGDFSGFELTGPVRIDGAGGDVTLQVSVGEIQVRAGGDLNCQMQAGAVQPMRLHAGGDVLLVLAENTPVAFDLRSNGHDININYGGQSVEIDKRFYQAVFGEGGVPVSVDANGDIRITSDLEEFDQEDLVDDMESHWHDVEEKREERSEEAEQAFTLRAEELSAHINHRVNDAMRQADARIQEAMKRLEQRTRRLERNFPGAPVPPIPPMPPVPPMSPMPPRRPQSAAAVEKKSAANEAEKALILKMLQEKKITAEEAEKLFEALES